SGILLAFIESEPDERHLGVAGQTGVIGAFLPTPVENTGELARQFQPAGDSAGRLPDRVDAVRPFQNLRSVEDAPERIGDDVRDRLPAAVLGFVEAHAVDPAGLRIAVAEHPFQMPRCRLEVPVIAAVGAQLGEPARQVGTMSANRASVYAL